jgi:hypothetical protein
MTPTTPIFTYGCPVGFAAAPVLEDESAPVGIGVLTVSALSVVLARLTVKVESLADGLGLPVGRPLGLLVKSVATNVDAWDEATLAAEERRFSVDAGVPSSTEKGSPQTEVDCALERPRREMRVVRRRDLDFILDGVGKVN